MNTSHNGSKFLDLFFLITPSDKIIEDVISLKNDVQKLLGHSFNSDHSKAHVSLYKDVESEANNTRSLYGIQFKLQTITPFKIFIKGINIFRHGSGGSIFLEIVNKAPVRDLFERLTTKKVSFTPHITIGRNLSPEDFVKAWSYLTNRKYSQHFLCDRITVLIRGENRWDEYDNILLAE